MTRPFTSKDFADETVEDLKFRLKNKSMTPEELRVEFAQRLNDGRLKFSTYTHKHLEERK